VRSGFDYSVIIAIFFFIFKIKFFSRFFLKKIFFFVFSQRVQNPLLTPHPSPLPTPLFSSFLYLIFYLEIEGIIIEKSK